MHAAASVASDSPGKLAAEEPLHISRRERLNLAHDFLLARSGAAIRALGIFEIGSGVDVGIRLEIMLYTFPAGEE